MRDRQLGVKHAIVGDFQSALIVSIHLENELAVCKVVEHSILVARSYRRIILGVAECLGSAVGIHTRVVSGGAVPLGRAPVHAAAVTVASVKTLRVLTIIVVLISATDAVVLILSVHI